jgi:triosephosphate isomerase
MKIQHYLITGEAVEYLQQQIKQKVHYYDLDNLIRAGAIDPPEMIGGRRMWSPKDLKAAAKALRIRRAKRPSLTQERSLVNNQEETNE